MTVLEVLQAATDYLAKHGVESPRLNAEYLLAHVLGKPKRIDLYLDFDRPLGESERAPLRELVRKRGEGVPLQHILGTVEFLGHTFKCDARALIPRPETEQLVELILNLLPHPSPRLLDVGTGSGVIILSIGLARPGALLSAGDLSQEALALARENAASLGLEARVDFQLGDLCSPFSGPFDVLAANLPYIPTAEIPTLSREVGHDPVPALDGGSDGLDLFRRLASTCPALLAPGALLALEIGHDQAARVAGMLAAHNFRDISPRGDYQNIERFIIARHG